MAPLGAGRSSTPPPRPATRPAERVGSEEYHSSSLPPAQEAAVLYAANLVAPAEAVLKAETRSPASRSNKQPWLMLFDLFEVTQNRKEYDALSMLYTVKFEQSPPAWNGSEDGADPRRAQNRERKDFFALKPNAMGELAPEIEKFFAFTESMGTVRLDLGKIASITASEAALLAGTFQRLRRARVPMWFNNSDSLERVLRAAFNERASDVTRSFWLLLFELFILQGKMEPFEELGLEYAVAYEMSPPIWEEYVNPVTASASRASVAPVAATEPEAGFAMKGVISTASQNQFADLATHAAAGAEIIVDMGKVLRIDFVAGAQFFEAVKAIQLAGKRVILSNLSELNAALLEAFGFNRHAILIRRKAN